MAQPRILLIWDRVGDYHRARWRALQQLVGPENVFIADLGASDGLYNWENTSTQESQYILLSGKPVDTPDFDERMRRFTAAVRKHQINVVGLAGYGRAEYRSMAAYARMNGIRSVLFAESWYPGNLIKDWAKSWLLLRSKFTLLVSGMRAKRHFVNRLRVNINAVEIGYSVVDNAHFASAGLADYTSKQLLCVARFSEEKNLPFLIQAFKQSQLPTQGWRLKLVGGGPLEASLKAMADDSIEISKWVSYDKLPALYAGASAFVLPSSFEPWGLVINEACAVGLPILVSKATGAAEDLVDDQNGWVFDQANSQDLVGKLNQLAGLSSEQLTAMGQQSIKKVASFTPATWAQSFLKLAGY